MVLCSVGSYFPARSLFVTLGDHRNRYPDTLAESAVASLIPGSTSPHQYQFLELHSLGKSADTSIWQAKGLSGTHQPHGNLQYLDRPFLKWDRLYKIVAEKLGDSEVSMTREGRSE